MADSKSTLYEQVEILAKECGSLYRDVRSCRDNLLGFMDANKWFGQEVSGSGDSICISDIEAVKERLLIWLRAFRRSPSEKMDILFEAGRERHPETCRLYLEYLVKKGMYGEEGSLRVLDYILSSIDREIILYTEEELQTILQEAGSFLAVANVKLLLDFLDGLKQEGLRLQYHYQTKPRQIVKRENSAYSLSEFARMAFWTFHPDSWKEHQMVEKAAASKGCAELWLFISLHFVCAWRKPDILRLPFPDLPYSPEETRNRIRNREFQDSEARELVHEWVYLVDLLGMKPSKTEAYHNIPTLKLFIPETLEQPFGMILALAASHRDKGTAWDSLRYDQRFLELFFGEEFAEIAGRKGFLSRRANKGLLQGLEHTADNSPGKPKGYMLAALARSHKSGIASLPDVTDIYLKDENFTGYKPEFILREMFERGIFGFIPALLLESYAGVQYRRLPVTAQTELIRCIGLSPLEIEAITSTVGKTLRKAEDSVRDIISGPVRTKEAVADLLQKIAVGAVPAKQPDMLCLRLAAGMTCLCLDRSCCIGCGYEIYTKAALQILIREYVDLSWQCNHADGWKKERFRKLMETGILIPVTEIITSVPMLYPDADMEPLLEMMERGIRHAAAPDC